MNATTDVVSGASIKMTHPKVDIRVNNDGGDSDDSIPFLFICMLNQRPKGQYESGYEQKKEIHIAQNKGIYDI
jgi:hypothetical protein